MLGLHPLFLFSGKRKNGKEQDEGNRSIKIPSSVTHSKGGRTRKERRTESKQEGNIDARSAGRKANKKANIDARKTRGEKNSSP